MSFEHITIITIITGIADITVIDTIIAGIIERNFLVRGRCGISFAAALHISGPGVTAIAGEQFGCRVFRTSCSALIYINAKSQKNSMSALR